MTSSGSLPQESPRRLLEPNTHVLRTTGALPSRTHEVWPPDERASVRVGENLYLDLSDHLSDDIGPYITCATICEAIELEPDGALSLRRIVDRVEIEVDSLAEDGSFPRVDVSIGLVVAVQAGRVRGEFGLGIGAFDPLGQRTLERGYIKVTFTDDEQLFAIASMTTVGVERPGVYWFTIRWSIWRNGIGRVLTRVPFAVDAVVRSAS